MGQRDGRLGNKGKGRKNLLSPLPPCLPIYVSPLLFFDHLWAGTDDVCKGQRECARYRHRAERRR